MKEWLSGTNSSSDSGVLVSLVEIQSILSCTEAGMSSWSEMRLVCDAASPSSTFGWCRWLGCIISTWSSSNEAYVPLSKMLDSVEPVFEVFQCLTAFASSGQESSCRCKKQDAVARMSRTDLGTDTITLHATYKDGRDPITSGLPHTSPHLTPADLDSDAQVADPTVMSVCILIP